MSYLTQIVHILSQSDKDIMPAEQNAEKDKRSKNV
jgi:hypothetical protein